MLFPEPGSWDRKEIYRERRHVKSESLGNSPVSSRWRDSQSFSYRENYHGGEPREFSRRGVSEYWRPPGRGRQQSDWHMFPEESGYGYMPSRSCERVVEDRGYWPASFRDDGRYRSGADYYKVRGYQKDWEGPGWQQNNSSSAIPGGKPFDGSPVFYGGKPCNWYSDMPVERRHNEMHPGFGSDRHFNMSPVISNGRPNNGFSGVSVGNTRNGFSPRNASERPLSLSPAVSWDKPSFGHSNASIEKSRNGFSGRSVAKTFNQAKPSITAERPINSSTRISVDMANDRFPCSTAVKASNKCSPFPADRSNQIPQDIAKTSFINASVETLRDGHSDGQAENKTYDHCSSVTVERPIQLTPSITRGNSKTGLTGAPVGPTPENISSSLAQGRMSYQKPSSTPVSNIDNDFSLHVPVGNAFKGLAIIPEEKPLRVSVGVSAINICDGMAGSVVTVPPLVNNKGELSNTEYDSKCLRVNTECLNTRPDNSLNHKPDIEPGEIHESFNTPRHDTENFMGADLKPLKWSRSGSLSSRGHCPSSRSILVDSKVTIDDSIKIKSTVLCSAAVGTADCLASSASSGEVPASKKARLGWGQGLAKYEKKVIDDPCDTKQNEICSPKVTGKCTPPVTPNSATCSFLPDTDDKFLKQVNMPVSFQLGGLESDLIPTTFEKLDTSYITTEVHRLLNMVSSDDQYPTAFSSGHESTNALSKLLLWKTSLLKAVEMTDSEIELLENEIQSSNSGCKNHVNCPAAPTPLHVDSSVVRENIDIPGTEISDALVPLSKVEATLQVAITRQNASMNSLHMMVEPTHTCDTDTKESHDILEIEGSTLCKFIFASNKEVAKKASDGLAQLLSKNETYVANCQEVTNNMLIRDQVAKRKKALKFSERAATLKYRALQQLWKEDARLLEIRKNRSKSSKRIELGTKTSQYAHQKSNLLCSRALSTEGSTKLVPSSQTVSLTSNLLSDFPVKVCKEELKMPPLVLDAKEKQMSRFVSHNGLVEDPVAVEKERAVMNSWTPDEKETFLDKFTLYGKNFRKIASSLEHKTTADCVEFYYKNHKSALFERTRKKPIRLGTKSNSVAKASYMLTSGDKWNQERVAADVLAGISDSLTSGVINPCISTSFNHADVQQWKRKKVGGKRKRTWTQDVVVAPNNDETCSGESCGEMEFSARDWTDEEKHKLLEAVMLYGNNFELVSKFVKTRYINECKAFYSKVKKRLGSTQKATAINIAGIRLDIKPDIDVRLKSPLLEPVL